MKTALLSDIHGNLPALQAVLDEAAREGVTRFVNLGDILSGPLWPAETARLLMRRDWPTLAGNHERWLLHRPVERLGASDAYAAARIDDGVRAWLATLPTGMVLDSGLVCCHGTPASDLQYLLETVVPGFEVAGHPGLRAASVDEVRSRLAGLAPGATLLACGHSHLPRLAWSDGVVLVNPGSVGLPAFDDDHPHPHVAESGSPHARWALVEKGESGWHVQLRATPYDWESTARQAEANGRPDWADALRTGRVGRREADLVRN